MINSNPVANLAKCIFETAMSKPIDLRLDGSIMNIKNKHYAKITAYDSGIPLASILTKGIDKESDAKDCLEKTMQDLDNFLRKLESLNPIQEVENYGLSN